MKMDGKSHENGGLIWKILGQWMIFPKNWMVDFVETPRQIWRSNGVFPHDETAQPHGDLALMILYDFIELNRDDIIRTGWWFGTFFIFPYVGNSHPN